MPQCGKSRKIGRAPVRNIINNNIKTINKNISTYCSSFPEGTSVAAQEICKATGLPPSFKNREETKFLLRLSQCQTSRCFDVNRSEKRGIHIFCAMCPEKCNFNILVRWTLEKGDHIKSGCGIHTCDISDHLLLGRKRGQTPASCAGFIAYYLKNIIREGTVSLTQLQGIILTNLHCTVKLPTIHKGVQIALEKYVFSDHQGFAL